MSKSLTTTCCIVGGGPAGMMLGLLLSRAGIDVIVLEKHADFLRDFRGDTIHPSTLELMHELGLLDEFLKRPHQPTREVDAQIGDKRFTVADFSHLPTRCKFIAFMPQWEFLNFLSEAAKRTPKFRLLMQAEFTGLHESKGRVEGVRARQAGEDVEIKAHLTVGCDGRHSNVRQSAGLKVQELGAPMDVLWLRFSKQADDPPHTFGRIAPGFVLIQIDRGDYWQCAFAIAKGSFDAVRQRGLEPFRAEIAKLAPHFANRVNELKTWDDAKLLTVAVDRLERWCKPGLLCIGDAAHAMSPVGGVGINLAIQDAVAAANILFRQLAKTRVKLADLARVQKRRMFPTRMTQNVQLAIQSRVIARVLTSNAKRLPIPFPLRLLGWFKVLRRIPARLIGVGVRPEHIRTPKIGWEPAAKA